MVFSSLTFLYIFLPINLILYYISKNQTYRNWVLIVFSLLFYAYGEPIWVILLIFSATVDFYLGLLIERHRGQWKSKAALICSVIVNLSLLGTFKYMGFFMENINYLLQGSIPYREFMLPIGISFYTFQTLSYSIDVYRGETKAQRQYHKFLLFVSLFHQLVAGPIVRYKDISGEIECRNISPAGFSYGVTRFVQGLGKKVLLANTAGSVAAKFLERGFESLTVAGAWLGISMFALQIYFDFSGYSDMAIGLGRMFGFTYKENFNYPYIAKSATDFWRRWHISLSSFFRDYLYIPLGGNRKFAVRNLLVVWFLTGLWHGASWNFVVWGLFYGFFILMERKFLQGLLQKMPAVFSHLYLLLVMLTGWVFFYYLDLSQGFRFLKIMFGFGGVSFLDTEFLIHFMNNLLFLMVAAFLTTPILKNLWNRARDIMEDKGIYGPLVEGVFKAGTVAVLLWVSTAFLVGATYNPFLYFRF